MSIHVKAKFVYNIGIQNIYNYFCYLRSSGFDDSDNNNLLHCKHRAYQSCVIIPGYSYHDCNY